MSSCEVDLMNVVPGLVDSGSSEMCCATTSRGLLIADYSHLDGAVKKTLFVVL